MSVPVLEDPAKGELREACEVAIDQAGYELVSSMVRVPLVSGLSGSLLGDLQSVDGTGRRTFYYLRAAPGDTLPKWLANLARESHELHAGDFYIVVRDYVPAFEQACIAAGAGLLVLTQDNAFQVVVNYADLTPHAVEAAFAAQIDELRRSLERKLELARGDVEQRYQRVKVLVSDMDHEFGEKYVEEVEREYKGLDDWSLDISRQLDGVAARPSAAALVSISEAIVRGPAVPGRA